MEMTAATKETEAMGAEEVVVVEPTRTSAIVPLPSDTNPRAGGTLTTIMVITATTSENSSAREVVYSK